MAFDIFETHCSGCHQRPGKEAPDLGGRLNPPPADLAKAARERTLQELFWVTKHGIRMSAMPAWGRSQTDQQLWTIATLIQSFPDMTGARYQALLNESRSEPESSSQ